MSESEDSNPGASIRRVVNTGENNRIMVGNKNTFVTLTLPSDASDSDLPTVSVPEESRDAAAAPPDVEVIMAGRDGNLQYGSTNLMVDAQRAKETTQDEALSDASLETTTYAVEEQGSLTVDADMETGPDSTSPQAMVHPLHPLQPNELSRKLQHTTVKTVDPPLTYMNIDPELDTQSEDFNFSTDGETGTQSIVDTDGDSKNVQFHQIIGQYLTTGPNNVPVDIEIEPNFREEAHRVEALPESQPPVRVLHLQWTGVQDPDQRCKISWRLKLQPHSISLESEVLRLMTSDMFSPLRNLAKRAYANYSAYLSEVFRGPLVFVFFHPDSPTASRMVGDRNSVKTLFRQMMVSLGRRDVDFSLEAIPSPEAVGVIQPARALQEGSSQDSGQTADIEGRMVSLETNMGQMMTMMNLLASRVLPPDSTQSTLAHSIQKVLDKADPRQKSEQLKTDKSSDETTKEHAEKDSTKTAEAISGPVLDSMSSESSMSMAMSMGGKKKATKPKPRRSTRSEKVFEEAERLLSSLNVASVGRSSTNREVRRLAEAVTEALVDDDPPPPRVKSMDTLLCLDVSESIGVQGVAEVKRIAHEFVDGILEVAEKHDVEENIALISMGGGARVAQQLTNDYELIKDAIDSLEVGGLSPIFETLCVCMAALKGRGGVLSVGGAHNIRPRIIFITDGKATNDAQEKGPDAQSTDQNTKIQLIRLMGQLSPKDHSSTPHPIVWVPVGDADRSFLESLAKLGSGVLVESAKIRSLCAYLQVQETIGKIYIIVKNKQEKFDLDETEAILGALAGDMAPEDKAEVLKGVQQKIETKEVVDPDNEPNDYVNVHEVPELPPLGTRVVRGPTWRYGDQDAAGPGTIINHSSEDKLLWVLWDFSPAVCRYRFGRDGKYDVTTVEDQPRILMSDELIEIGIKVKRGPDWTHGDIDGGPDGVGVVIRRRQDGKVKVRWQTGEIKSCKFGYDGKFDLQICNEDSPKATPTAAPSPPPQPRDVSPDKPHVMWQKKDDLGQWRLYRKDEIEKLNAEFAKRPMGSCVLNKHGKNRRVYFNTMTERDSERGAKREVRKKVVNDEERDELICMEMTVDEGYTWTK